MLLVCGSYTSDFLLKEMHMTDLLEYTFKLVMTLSPGKITVCVFCLGTYIFFQMLNQNSCGAGTQLIDFVRPSQAPSTMLCGNIHEFHNTVFT
jgi:hypothetical protein